MLLYGVSFIQQLVIAVCTRKNAEKRAQQNTFVWRSGSFACECVGMYGYGVEF